MHYEFNQESLSKDLNQLLFISQFVCYNKFNEDKDKLQKKLKKMIHHVDKGDVIRIMSDEWIEENM